MLEPNPIVTFLRELLGTGETTKEKICVACDLKYPTLDNVFLRETVSPFVRRSLFYSGVIPKHVLGAYETWLLDYRKAKKDAKKPVGRKGKPRKQGQGIKRDIETKDEPGGSDIPF